MEKYLAAFLLATSVSVNAKVIQGAIPVVCTDMEGFAEAITDFNEEPMLTALSSRDMGSGGR